MFRRPRSDKQLNHQLAALLSVTVLLVLLTAASVSAAGSWLEALPRTGDPISLVVLGGLGLTSLVVGSIWRPRKT